MFLGVSKITRDNLPGHAKYPRQPLKEESLDPVWHLVGVDHPVVIVEDHDGGHHAAGDHEHYAVEIRPWNSTIIRPLKCWYDLTV